MDFGEDRRPSVNKMIGIGAVLLLHVFLIYALVSGLATSAVEMIKKPLEIKIIQAAAPPPPPPPKIVLPPPPALVTPPPPYIPPPLIQVQAPPQPVFAVVTHAKPVAPPPTAPAVKAPANTSVTSVCPNVGDIANQLSDAFGNISDSAGINSASVTVVFTLMPNGAVTNPRIVSSTFAGVNGLALRGVGQLECRGQAQPVQVLVPFAFEAN
ncbi:MAG: hypothetical protein POH28_08510 [Acidocella sp.]|nr:hypothetical protein [Acidocella sp.]